MVDCGPDELKHALAQVGVALRAGPAPDVAAAVRARLEPAPAPSQARQRTSRRRSALAAALAGVTLALVPGVRGAVADLVDSLPGVTLRTDEGATVATPPVGAPVTAPVTAPGDPLGAALGLVGETDLATARTLVPYDLPLPSAVGDPGAVYVREGVVTMVWPASPALPALAGSDVGLVVDVVDGSRGPLFEKLLLGVEVEWFTIDDVPAAWVGTPHPLVVVNADGVPDRSDDRIAARTLLVSGATTVRVESMLDRDSAIALVRSFG